MSIYSKENQNTFFFCYSALKYNNIEDMSQKCLAAVLNLLYKTSPPPARTYGSASVSEEQPAEAAGSGPAVSPRPWPALASRPPSIFSSKRGGRSGGVSPGAGRRRPPAVRDPAPLPPLLPADVAPPRPVPAPPPGPANEEAPPAAWHHLPRRLLGTWRKQRAVSRQRRGVTAPPRNPSRPSAGWAAACPRPPAGPAAPRAAALRGRTRASERHQPPPVCLYAVGLT